MSWKFLIALVLFFPSPLSTVCFRCSVPSIPQAFKEAEAVFIGKVVSVEDPGVPTDDRLSFKVIDLVRPIKVRFVIEHVYRGNEINEMVIATQTGGLEFGHEFKIGEKYLVYALANGDEKSELVVKGCGRTRSVEEAKDDIKILEATVQRRVY